MSGDFVFDKSFSAHVSNVLNNTHDYDVELQFYMTNHCNLSCPGCYMHAGPKLSRKIIPSGDVDFYLNEFSSAPGFSETVVFTGGEIFNDLLINLERSAQSVLARGWHLQLKTNGAWGMQPEKRAAVLDMLARLKPGRGLMASEEDVRRFLSCWPRPILKWMGRKRIMCMLYKFFPNVSNLDIVVSVDDRLHPAQSAYWFAEIVNAISVNRYLKKNVGLKTFTLSESAEFFEKYVLGNPKLKSTAKQIECLAGDNHMSYRINGKDVSSFFGDFVDVDNIPEFKKISEFVLPSVDGKTKGRLVYCFHPDRTVGLDSCYLKSVGRVPYVAANGKRKSFAQINREIQQKLIQEYQYCMIK